MAISEVLAVILSKALNFTSVSLVPISVFFFDFIFEI